jgi:hypothetical protein
MPKRLRVIAWLFILSGGLSFWSFLSAWARPESTLLIDAPLGSCMLLVGMGLLNGKASSRRWGVFWLAVNAVKMGALIVMVALRPWEAQAHFFDIAVRGPLALPWIFGIAAAFLVGYFVVLLQLYSAPVEAYIRGCEATRAALIAAMVAQRQAASADAGASVEQAHRADAVR